MIDYKSSLDELLAIICKVLQLSPSQHESAVGKYEAVGLWLGGPGSPLESFAASIYPQGSMAIGTTVKPIEEAEHDLDLIFEVNRIELAPADLHRIVEARLQANSLYKVRLVYPAPPRCLRLEYAGDFHLDIVPARRDPARGPTAIEVPDRKLKRWVPNNPLEYQSWFERQSVSLVIMEKAAIQPIPALTASEQKPPLKLAVQLMKRHRDVAFGRAIGAPSSILLTTLAAKSYRGDASVASALMRILATVEDEVRSSWPGRISVPNPTNAAEDLCSKFSDEQYEHFAQWVVAFSDEFRKLKELTGLEKIAAVLKALFGESITTSVIKSYVQRLDEARKAGALRYGASGLGVTRGVVVPRHTFHGEE